MKCPHCGSSSTGSDGSDVTCVCHDCGAVIEEGTFQNDPNLAEGSQNVTVDVNFVSNGTEASTLPDAFMKSARSATQRTYVCKGKRQGLNTIKELFKRLSVSERPLVQEAIDMYMDVSTNQHYKFQNLQKKEIIAGICVMVVCRNHDIPITLTFISKILGVREQCIRTAFFKFRKQSNVPMKQLNILDLVAITCGGQSEECIKFTKQILSLVKKSWIMEGRYRDAVIMAANYFAWQALDFQHRLNVPLKDYVQQKGWKLNPSLACRYKEMGQVFCSLASELPWLTDQHIELKRIAFYLKDIVAYHRSLISDINSEFDRSGNGMGEGDCSKESQNMMPKSSVPTKMDVMGACKDYGSTALEGQTEQLRNGAGNSQMSPSRYEHIVLPTSFMRASSVSESVMINDGTSTTCHPNIDSEILSEADIRDEDLKLYIKQPDEIDNGSIQP
ncbi:hypothetical protein LSH36_506g02051 [Paralvinella palmiformis]|uniref:Transcription factor IIIB 50 kDa subunit n=1 Tax=Paralvinella palmiformis TaxID=53620 RepID=A0AAD9J8K4_9ANNE|nr:hypothetical protein LSH36_506g02051 [Paralvinella palmiformis]